MKLYEHYRSAFPALVAQLENARHHRRLSHAFLVQADTDRSRREFAMVLAQIAACPESQGGRPCLECRVCRELEAGSYPELYTLSPVGKMYQIKVGDRNDPDPQHAALLRGAVPSDQHRRRRPENRRDPRL